MKKILSLSIVAILAMAESALSFGNNQSWESGFGQGTREAMIEKGPGNSIYVACEAGSGRPSSIYFKLSGNAPNGSRITLTFDNQDPEQIWITDGQITSDCRACAANFTYIIEKLKSGESVHVLFQNGNGARFSLNGSAKAIGDCKAGFYQ